MEHLPAEAFLAPISEPTRAQVLELASVLHGRGFQCWLVGGSVRDLLLGRAVGDLDFTTDARPREVQKAFRRTIPTGIEHGTITVLLNGGAFEVTTFRGESEYTDARRPDSVRFSSSLSEDLTRRDFTVNALAWDPLTGRLVDEHGGLEDLNNGVLRTIGLPEDRFLEDGLRPVRACRFAATLEFEPDAQVLAALRLTAVHKRTARVALERFADELRKGLRAAAASRMIHLLEESGLRDLFLPAETLLSQQALAALDAFHPAAVELKLAFWWRSLHAADLGGTARKLKFSNRESRTIATYGRFLQFLEAEPLPAQARLRHVLSEIRESLGDGSLGFVQGIPSGVFPGLNLEEMQRSLQEDPLSVADLAIGGKELLARGVHGPAVGQMLRGLLAMVIENPDRNTVAELEACLAEMQRSPAESE